LIPVCIASFSAPTFAESFALNGKKFNILAGEPFNSSKLKT